MEGRRLARLGAISTSSSHLQTLTDIPWKAKLSTAKVHVDVSPQYLLVDQEADNAFLNFKCITMNEQSVKHLRQEPVCVCACVRVYTYPCAEFKKVTVNVET